MASITSLMNSSSSTSSLYGNRNVISGLASGMDTEAMIENSISGYKTKITSLQQKMTKLQWKQDAYRSLITQMNSLLNKYMDYTSSTNLLSSSFFTQAVNTVAGGANAAKVAVSGKSSSNVQIDRIKSLAQAATYSVSANKLVAKGSETKSIEWNEDVVTSNTGGTMRIQIGSGTGAKSFSLSLDSDKIYNNVDELVDDINSKLAEQTVSGLDNKAGHYVKAQKTADGGFEIVANNGGNQVEVTGASGNLAATFTRDGGKFTLAKGEDGKKAELSTKVKRLDYLKDQSINVTLDGKSRNINLSDMIDDTFEGLSDKARSEKLAAGLQKKVDEAFGTGKIEIGANADGSLKINSLKEGSTLSIGGNAAANEALGFGEGGYSNTVQTGWSLEKVLGSAAFTETRTDEDGNEYQAADLIINDQKIELRSTDTIKDMMDKINSSDANVTVKYSNLTGEFSFTANETGVDSRVEIEGDLGKALFNTPDDISKVTFNDAYGVYLNAGETRKFNFKFQGEGSRYEFNGITISDTDTVGDILNKLNTPPLVRDEHFSFNEHTGEFEYTDQFGEKFTLMGITDQSYGFSYELQDEYKPVGKYTEGQDAVLDVTVNGKQMTLTRSSNNVDLDGYNVTLKGEFGYKEDGSVDNTAEAITFQTNTDTDKIINTVKDFVKDYNEMVTALRGAYTTEPLKKSNKEEYLPLTDEDQADMSETAIKNYEEKAKTGLLYADTDLANLYSKLTSAVQGSGGMTSTLRSIGIDVNYSNNLTTLSVDEDKLRSALESDPDKVKNAFTQTTSSGASANGMMTNLRSTLQSYASTSIGSPGILVNKAGTTLSSYSLNNNELNDQINALQEEIDKWQDRMSDRVDYYTNQFTQLELLINQMNSQSSMLAGLSGGM